MTSNAAEQKKPNIHDAHNLRVSDHAIRRHKERTGALNSDLKIAHDLREIVAYGFEVEIHDPVMRLKQTLNHDCKPARYFRSRTGKSIVVVEEGVIVTSHLGEAGKWKKKQTDSVN